MSEELLEVPVLAEDLLDVFLPEQELVIFDDEHRSEAPACVGVDFYFSLVDVSDD